MGDVTSHPLANQAEACLFGRSLNTSLCEIYDHKAAFLLVKTVVHKNFNLHILHLELILLYLSFIMSVSLHLHSSLIHSLICTKNDSNNNLFSE